MMQAIWLFFKGRKYRERRRRILWSRRAGRKERRLNKMVMNLWMPVLMDELTKPLPFDIRAKAGE